MLLRFENRRGVGLYSLADGFGWFTDKYGNRRPMSRKRQWQFRAIWGRLCALEPGDVPDWLTDDERDRVRFWFTADARHLIRAAMDFRDLARRYGLYVRIRFTRNPGWIIYADKLQVAAVGPCKSRIRRQPRWNGDRASVRNWRGRKQLAKAIRCGR